MSKGCECAADELGFLSEAAFTSAFTAACTPMRLYCYDDEPAVPWYPTFDYLGEATHEYQNAASTPVPLAEGTGDFVTEAAGTNVTFTYTNESCWPIRPALFGVMFVIWNQTAGCSIQWNLKIHEDGLLLIQTPVGMVGGNDDHPEMMEQFSLVYPGNVLLPGDSVTYQVRPEVTATGTTGSDEVVMVAAAVRAFGGGVTL